MSSEQELADSVYSAVYNASSVEMAEWEYRNYLQRIDGRRSIDSTLSLMYLYAHFCYSTEEQQNKVTLDNCIRVSELVKAELAKRGKSVESLSPERVEALLRKEEWERAGSR